MDYNNKLYINQVIPTVQGEGKRIGIPSILLRLNGCNCRCPWCDTKHTWDIKNSKTFVDFETLERLIKSVKEKYQIKNLMITGGEPFLYKHNPIFIQLIKYAFSQNWTVEIETNGSLLYDLPPHLYKSILKNIQLNISPKLNISWYHDKNDFETLENRLKELFSLSIFKYPPILKFVNDPSLWQITEKMINTFKDKTEIFLMPLTPDRNKYNDYNHFLYDYKKQALKTLNICMENGFTLSNRIHLYLFDNEKEEF